MEKWRAVTILLFFFAIAELGLCEESRLRIRLGAPNFRYFEGEFEGKLVPETISVSNFSELRTQLIRSRIKTTGDLMAWLIDHNVNSDFTANEIGPIVVPTIDWNGFSRDELGDGYRIEVETHWMRIPMDSDTHSDSNSDRYSDSIRTLIRSGATLSVDW